jgi:hypothetical protein
VFGVRQPCCRAHHTHRGGRVPALTPLAMGSLDTSVLHHRDTEDTARINTEVSHTGKDTLPDKIARVWSAAAMLPRPPHSPQRAYSSANPAGKGQSRHACFAPQRHRGHSEDKYRGLPQRQEYPSRQNCPCLECASHAAAPTTLTVAGVFQR